MDSVGARLKKWRGAPASAPSITAYRRFLIIAGTTALACGLPFLLNYWLFTASGELTGLDELVWRQHVSDALYGTALHDVRREHKLKIIEYRKPEIIALGSSRALDFRQEYFSRKFACACQAMKSLDEGRHFVDALVATHVPRLVIFALDFWWFTSPEGDNRGPPRAEDAVLLTEDKIVEPFFWLAGGTITFSDYFRLLTRDRHLHGVTRHPKIGVQAIKRSIGIRRDGSHFMGPRFDVTKGRRYYRNSRSAIVEAKTRVLVPGGRYGPDQSVRPERIAMLKQILDVLRAHGSEIILIIPPIVPQIIDAWGATGRHDFMPTLVKEIGKLAAGNHEFYSFHDPRHLDSGVCEFADTRHGGNTLYMRILREVLQRNPGSRIADYVDASWLDENIERFKGKTVATFDAERYLAHEFDFLDLGCPK